MILRRPAHFERDLRRITSYFFLHTSYLPKMIRGFLGLLLILGAVAALARDTSAAPAATDAKQRPGFQSADKILASSVPSS
jgi:hypothetical protein